MPLQLGDWVLVANGYYAMLHIDGVDTQGNLSGTVTFGSEASSQLNNVALWNDTTKEITFIRVVDPADPATFQIYTGYWFLLDAAQPDGPQFLAGSFIAFPGSGGSASRPVWGWVAKFSPPGARDAIASGRSVDQDAIAKAHLLF